MYPQGCGCVCLLLKGQAGQGAVLASGEQARGSGTREALLLTTDSLACFVYVIPGTDYFLE